MKCLSTTKLPQAHGNILHDWHAETLAIRAFNRFLLDECLALLSSHTPSQFITQQNHHRKTPNLYSQPFTLQDDVQIHMYSSEAPCGDASMELVMEAQEDATPWTSTPSTVSPINQDTEASTANDTIHLLRGRSHFALLGAVRLKPSRPDAPPTLSKSCSDKLALKQCTSLLSSLTSLVLSPRNAYIASLVLPQSQYVEAACTRAFHPSGRMGSVTADMEQRWGGGYAFRPFSVQTTSREFKFSRRSVSAAERPVPCNLSAVYTPRFQETLVGGVLQGRKQFDPRGASAICRRSVWRAVAEIAGIVGVPVLVDAVRRARYGDVKSGEMLAAKRRVKEDVRGALRGWIGNSGDDEFGIMDAE